VSSRRIDRCAAPHDLPKVLKPKENHDHQYRELIEERPHLKDPLSSTRDGRFPAEADEVCREPGSPVPAESKAYRGTALGPCCGRSPLSLSCREGWPRWSGAGGRRYRLMRLPLDEMPSISLPPDEESWPILFLLSRPWFLSCARPAARRPTVGGGRCPSARRGPRWRPSPKSPAPLHCSWCGTTGRPVHRLSELRTEIRKTRHPRAGREPGFRVATCDACGPM